MRTFFLITLLFASSVLAKSQNTADVLFNGKN